MSTTGDWFTATLRVHPSFCWSGILHARDLIAAGVWRPVGDGNAINILEDPWVSRLARFRASWPVSRRCW